MSNRVLAVRCSHDETYHGRPMQKHTPLPVGATYFDHWLALFAESAHELRRLQSKAAAAMKRL